MQLMEAEYIDFVTVGSQKFQFNRLLEEVDRLVEEKNKTR